MRLLYTERFRRAYSRLDEEGAGRVDGAIRMLAADPRHPGLRVKRIQGTEDVWEACASRSVRITFEMRGDLLLLRNVGPHDITLKNP